MKYAADNQRAYAVFQQARERFILGDFAEARIELLEYRRLVDYSRFTQTDNRKAIRPICSIILVIYNADKQAFLECLQSCLAQKDSTFEVIVVDNGGNQALCADLETHPVLHVISSGNLLPSEGRNVGAYFAKGEYLVFVDDDGILASDYLYQVEQALQHKNTLGIRGRILPKTPQGQTNIHYDLGDQVKSSIFDLEGNMAIKRLLFEQVRGFDPLMFGHEGCEMTERCLEYNPGMQVLYWPKMLLYHDYAEGQRLQEKRERQQVGSDYQHYLKKLKDFKLRNNTIKRNMMSQTGISIILRADNNWQAAKKFLEQFVKTNSYSPVEVIVLFDKPEAAHTSLVRELAGQLRIIVLPAANRTFAQLENKVRYEHILILSLPLAFKQDCLLGSLNVLKQHGKAVIGIDGLEASILILKKQLSNISKALLSSRKKDLLELLGNNTALKGNVSHKEKVESNRGRNLKKKLSIIIPVFNKEGLLNACLESILQNGYENIEIICIDDCSSDGSLSVLQSYKENRKIQILKQPQNRGASEARNRGISVSKGEYLFFVDADDQIPKGAFAKLINMAEAYGSDIVRGKITGRKADGSRHILAKENILHNEFVALTNWEKSECLWFYWYFSCNLYRSSFIKKNNIIFPTGLRNEDPLFLCRCFLSTDRVTLIPDIVYHYSIGNEQRRKTPSYDFLKGWSLTNYYLFQFLQNKTTQCNYFLFNFPSLLPHSLNAVKYQSKEKATAILRYLKLMFSNIDDEWVKYPEKQPWENKVILSLPVIEYIETLKTKKEEDVYRYLVKKVKLDIHAPSKGNELISIVMPVYNSRMWLLQSFTSVLFQSYKNWELICIDDSSSDGSFELLSELARLDRRVVVIKNDINRGKAASRNIGIKKSKGDYLFFLDSDDWLSFNALENLINVIKDDNVDLAMGKINLIRDGTGEISEGWHSRYQNLKIIKTTPSLCSDLYENAIVCNKLISRDFFYQCNSFFNEKLTRFEDTELSMKWWVNDPKVTLVDEVTYFYRQQANDTADRSNRKPGGSDYATKHRLLMIKELIKYESDIGIIGESNLFPILMIMLIKQMRWSKSIVLDDNIELVKDIILMIPSEVYTRFNPVIKDVLNGFKNSEPGREMLKLNQNWEPFNKLAKEDVIQSS